MFTDFSSYSRQAKTIRPLSMVEINQGINRDPCAPKCETDSATGEQYCPTNQPSCAAFKNADGSWTEIRGENSDEIDKAYDQLTQDNVIETAKADYSSDRDYNVPTTPTTPDTGYKGSTTPNTPTTTGGKTGGGGGGGGGGSTGGGGGSYQMPTPDPATPTDFSKTGDGSTTPPEISAPSSSTGQGTTPSTSTNQNMIGTPMTTDFSLQSTPAYAGQSGSNPPQYPAVGVTDGLINTSGSDAWVTDYNSVGFMDNDPIMGGTYSAPSGDNFSTTQGTNPATQVGVAYPLQQDIYDTYSNVTGAQTQYMGGSPSFNEATGQYVNATSNTIANPNTLPTTLSAWDLFGTAGASSGLFLDTPTIKQNGVATTPAVDTETIAEPEQGGGLGLITIGLIALKALSVI
jgi:hypothetical protein